jgi:hypothetical protein
MGSLRVAILWLLHVTLDLEPTRTRLDITSGPHLELAS